MHRCTGCTESLLRATHPTIENLILNTISLEYHEVLSAAFGHQAEENKHNAIKRYKGRCCPNQPANHDFPSPK
ncbi:hypothetical protein ASJ32_22770 [Aeromonas salmonicida subsp. salmonicida]|nr:hypothetical protein ASJ32_22770 [Aeromonas salmonicida subsp. salmonicida]